MAVEKSLCSKIKPDAAAKNVAVIFGVTGLVGIEIVRKLLSKSGWQVYGIARSCDQLKRIQDLRFQFISCDLLNSLEAQKKLSFLQREVTHIFWVTWASQFPLDSKECCEQNKLMMSNALNAILPGAKSLKHVSLQTGIKHYVSLEGSMGANEVHFYNEECPRAQGRGQNFYYVLEDLLKERLASKVSWSVHRPGIIMGASKRTLYNFMGSLCVYGAICKHLNLPFLFGGTKECWEEMYIDGSDARLVADQHIWAATNDTICSSTDGQAFNAINGLRFTWKEIWPAIGKKLGVVVPQQMFSQDLSFLETMSDKGRAWKEIVEKEGLVQTEMDDLANWAFLDLLFRFPRKMLGARDKADRLGFIVKYQTLDSILYWIDVMRGERLIP